MPADVQDSLINLDASVLQWWEPVPIGAVGNPSHPFPAIVENGSSMRPPEDGRRIESFHCLPPLLLPLPELRQENQKKCGVGVESQAETAMYFDALWSKADRASQYPDTWPDSSWYMRE